MHNLFQLFAKYGAFLVFLGLEFVAFYLIVNYNHTQKEIFVNSSNLLTGKIYQEKNDLIKYLNLDRVNDSLVQENAQLLKEIIYLKGYTTEKIPDSLFQFEVIPATITNQSITNVNNHLTLNQGKDAGIEKGMGVINKRGIIGIVKEVSKNYSHVISILNSQTRISAKIKNLGYIGNIYWDAKDSQILTMAAIPKHATISKGDTILTSGYSTVFPPNIVIGRIEDFLIDQGSSNYSISVKLNNDMSSLHYVYVIKNFNRNEQLSLEKGDE